MVLEVLKCKDRLDNLFSFFFCFFFSSKRKEHRNHNDFVIDFVTLIYEFMYVCTVCNYCYFFLKKKKKRKEKKNPE
jgi:hypothetical protein